MTNKERIHVLNAVYIEPLTMRPREDGACHGGGGGEGLETPFKRLKLPILSTLCRFHFQTSCAQESAETNKSSGITKKCDFFMKNMTKPKERLVQNPKINQDLCLIWENTTCQRQKKKKSSDSSTHYFECSRVPVFILLQPD